MNSCEVGSRNFVFLAPFTSRVWLGIFFLFEIYLKMIGACRFERYVANVVATGFRVVAKLIHVTSVTMRRRKIMKRNWQIE
jgi:hypothetical protein